ncbi:hypothetical protein GCM10009721_05450 [Terrabacter tumescens]|uniref:Glycosyltransferase n=1 Tax=Terrabacter tumescens TaxID=60443 RepID=A0ABQ2HJJ3_9MICO|nr:hypothetical protein GCM10009721_05450 [Terrabacter tumescens]
MSSASTQQGHVGVEMVIPLKWPDGLAEKVAEMTRYLERIGSSVAAITVVDGSGPVALEQHRRAWGRLARVVPPDHGVISQVFGHGPRPGRKTPSSHLNGKVLGALTGIHASRHELVILADDDVRHTGDSITRLVSALAGADLVRPVNLYDTWPWQAQWDGARSLMNIALGTDWPGTFGLRRSAVLTCGGWSADVLFENLELWRTVKAAGGRVVGLGDVVVPRQAPEITQFWSQRVRQAYDDLAQPGRLLVELGILPMVVLGARRPASGAGMLALAVLVAAWGRRRVGAGGVPRTVPLWAPVWVLERGLCIWVAMASRLRGGARYHGGRLPRAAHSESELCVRLVARERPRQAEDNSTPGEGPVTGKQSND